MKIYLSIFFALFLSGLFAESSETVAEREFEKIESQIALLKSKKAEEGDFNLGLLLYKKAEKSVERRDSLLKEYLDKMGNSAEAAFFLGVYHYTIMDFDTALVFLYEAAFKWNYPDAYHYLACYYEVPKDWEKNPEPIDAKKAVEFRLKSAELGSFWSMACMVLEHTWPFTYQLFERNEDKAYYWAKRFVEEAVPKRLERWKICEENGLDSVIYCEKISYYSILNFMAVYKLKRGDQAEGAKILQKAFEEISKIPEEKRRKFYNKGAVNNVIENLAILYYKGIEVEKDEMYALELLKKYNCSLDEPTLKNKGFYYKIFVEKPYTIALRTLFGV